jgi:hypothetical protein
MGDILWINDTQIIGASEKLLAKNKNFTKKKLALFVLSNKRFNFAPN